MSGCCPYAKLVCCVSRRVCWFRNRSPYAMSVWQSGIVVCSLGLCPQCTCVCIRDQTIVRAARTTPPQTSPSSDIGTLAASITSVFSQPHCCAGPRMLLTDFDRSCVQVPPHISPRSARLLGMYVCRVPYGTEIATVASFCGSMCATESADSAGIGPFQYAGNCCGQCTATVSERSSVSFRQPSPCAGRSHHAHLHMFLSVSHW